MAQGSTAPRGGRQKRLSLPLLSPTCSAGERNLRPRAAGRLRCLGASSDEALVTDVPREPEAPEGGPDSASQTLDLDDTRCHRCSFMRRSHILLTRAAPSPHGPPLFGHRAWCSAARPPPHEDTRTRERERERAEQVPKPDGPSPERKAIPRERASQCVPLCEHSSAVARTQVALQRPLKARRAMAPGPPPCRAPLAWRAPRDMRGRARGRLAALTLPASADLRQPPPVRRPSPAPSPAPPVAPPPPPTSAGLRRPLPATAGRCRPPSPPPTSAGLRQGGELSDSVGVAAPAAGASSGSRKAILVCVPRSCCRLPIGRGGATCRDSADRRLGASKQRSASFGGGALVPHGNWPGGGGRPAAARIPPFALGRSGVATARALTRPRVFWDCGPDGGYAVDRRTRRMGEASGLSRAGTRRPLM